MRIPHYDKKTWLGLSAVTVATMAALHYGGAAMRRRQRRNQGECGALKSDRRWVQRLRTHTLVGDTVSANVERPVVLVHGFGASSASFLPTAERLAARFQLYAPDLPGHGSTDAPEHAYNVAEHADFLIAWMDAMGLETASLVGHCMGCQIAIDVALRYPERVERLVLLSPTPDPEMRSLLRLYGRFMVGGLRERPALNMQLFRDYKRMGRRLPQELRTMLGDPVEQKVLHVQVPTLLVRGEHDTVVPRAWLEQVKQTMGSGAQLTEVPGTGHVTNFRAAGALVERIAPFLGEARTPGSHLVAAGLTPNLTAG